jgi:hypothetical protein
MVLPAAVRSQEAMRSPTSIARSSLLSGSIATQKHRIRLNLGHAHDKFHRHALAMEQGTAGMAIGAQFPLQQSHAD